MSTVASNDQHEDTGVLPMSGTGSPSSQIQQRGNGAIVPSYERATAGEQGEAQAAASCSAVALRPSGVATSADVVSGSSSVSSPVQPSWMCSIARSQDKKCGICFETIMEKEGGDKRFGILPRCNHVFCFQCISTWRQAKQYAYQVTRACPECRVWSNFVCPSVVWVEEKEEKDQLINDYLAALSAKDCKYFRKGKGVCLFGNKCFFKHALPDGELIDAGLPTYTHGLPIPTDFMGLANWFVDVDDSSSDDSDFSDSSDEN
ncbi:E3 ubiquitin-protein ligase RFWD3 [Drosophila mauritiana]|uniref:RING-type E3 ubiquitin transferase n=1 Tax=Drosophila mauritiana TaxID=7226 RepID=A0A6P8K7C0_DROMA|nr:E3 ubiquitin-protein ligase RFWD3 [Drosophila mauritiana]